MSDAGVEGSVSDVLFSLDLGINGGIWEPTSYQEIRDWVSRESQFWTWVGSVSAGNHRNAIDEAMRQLSTAGEIAMTALGAAPSDPSIARRHLDSLVNQLRSVFLDYQLPHSTSVLGRQAEEIRRASPIAAIAFVFAVLLKQGGYRFEAADVAAWHGFVQGLIARFGPLVGEGSIKAHGDALSEIGVRMERLLSEKTTDYASLQKRIEVIGAEIQNTRQEQLNEWQENLSASEHSHAAALEAHQAEMQALRQTFREGMALRGPVEYWQSRESKHSERAKSMAKWAFGSIAALAALLGGAAWIVFAVAKDPAKPEPWLLVVLGLVGVLGVWALRLIIRIYLSDAHLATDAAERVTMVQTYLALMEDQKLTSDEDRKLILQPLFRPAADGIVRDEGLPHPLLELITRSGKQ